MCPSSGSVISTFGTSPSRRKLRVRCRRACRRRTRKSSMRTRRPSTFSPGRCVTVDRHLAPARARRRLRRGRRGRRVHRRHRPRRSAAPRDRDTRASDALPGRRSPNGTSCTSLRSTPFPRPASPTTMLSSTAAPAGGAALSAQRSRRRCGCTRRPPSRRHREIGSGGIGGMPGFCRPFLTTG